MGSFIECNKTDKAWYFVQCMDYYRAASSLRTDAALGVQSTLLYLLHEPLVT